MHMGNFSGILAIFVFFSEDENRKKVMVQLSTVLWESLR
jgi:hypothetical protein